ncbi:MAG: tetratricopeptide repeat protein [Candidatus Didemnitutus sp.]|nr:tetratricopeptide repeat protein [Candidatus Didemnitutus sp.]
MPPSADEPSYFPPEDARELLRLDEPMRRFFAERVDRRAAHAVILQQIVAAIVRPTDLGFAYASDGLYDARESFRRRRGGCVSFAILVAAVAREYGVAVQFQEMDTAARWNRFEGFVASVRHTNLRLVDATHIYTVDLRPDLGRADDGSGSALVVPDRRAFAHFYSTAGFFRLVAGDTAGALRLMKLGTECDAKSCFVWANLGQLYARTGDLPQARDCLEQSLRLDRHGEMVLVCLVDVLRRQGGVENLKLAEKYERRAQAMRVRNPYYHFNLAVVAQDTGDWQAVERHVRQAMRLKDDEIMFHELLVEALRRLERTADAQRAEARLAALRERSVPVHR